MHSFLLIPKRIRYKCCHLLLSLQVSTSYQAHQLFSLTTTSHLGKQLYSTYHCNCLLFCYECKFVLLTEVFAVIRKDWSLVFCYSHKKESMLFPASHLSHPLFFRWNCCWPNGERITSFHHLRLICIDLLTHA